MGNVFVIIGTGIGWCFCTATSSLISSCCGNDKPSTIAPGVHSGRKRSVFLLLFSIGISLFYQYYVGPAMKPSHIGGLNPVLSYLSESWMGGCDEYLDNDDADDTLRQKCSGNNGVYRAAGSALVFYLLAGIASYCKPSANREAWPAKIALFIFLVIGTIFIPNDPLFSPVFLNIFRVGAIFFMIFNQLIIIDMAFNVNESWVEKSDKAELDEGEGAGKKWLGALLASCAILVLGSLVAIGLMFYYFTGCTTNNIFITITLIAGIVLTIIQLTGEEASLFTSSCIFAYSTYLCYTAVTKNPNAECNPQLGEENFSGIILGLIITLIGMAWTGYSHTAHRAVGEASDHADQNANEDDAERTPIGVTGVLLSSSNHDGDSPNDGDGNENQNSIESFSSSWKINLILAFICCWYAMCLTSWGTVASAGNVANPSAGDVSMWMVICSQWLMNLLYLWTLLAAKIFPDRDFN
mmetsp:Transcript_6801/g.10166  ORF Transcript_6801/g.10166 Transcript_6801/m.10166 type:complete len:467 (+) Transcript_6801:54-1454(+)